MGYGGGSLPRGPRVLPAAHDTFTTTANLALWGRFSPKVRENVGSIPTVRTGFTESIPFRNESTTDSTSVSWQRRHCCLCDDHRLRLRSVDTVGRKGETLYALKMTPDQRSVPCSFCPRGVTFHWVVGVGTHPIPWLHLNCLSIQTIPRGAITVFVESAVSKGLGVSGIALSPIF